MENIFYLNGNVENVAFQAIVFDGKFGFRKKKASRKKTIHQDIIEAHTKFKL